MKGKYSTSGLHCVENETLQLLYNDKLDCKNELIQLLKSYHQCDNIVLFNSGFWALVAALKTKLNRAEGNGVLMPSLTYRRLADVVYWAGGTPVFADVDPKTLALCADNVASLLSTRDDIGAVLLVQPIVGTVDVSQMISVCEQANVQLVVDSVESVHDTVKGARTGSFTVNEVFSLHASKFINGFEGGYVAAGCYEDEAELGSYRQISESFSLDMNRYHAHIAACNLKNIDEFVRHNKRIYEQYLFDFSKAETVPLRIKTFPEIEQCGYKNIVAAATKPDVNIENLCNFLNNKGIGARLHYQPPLHSKTYQYDVKIAQALEVTESVGTKLINLPCGWRFNADDISFVLENMEDYFSGR